MWGFSLLLSACDDGTNYAPVTDLSGIEPIPKTGLHRVKTGETLYEIAWRYGLDYRDLATRNHIPAPYTIPTQQVIFLSGDHPVIAAEKGPVTNNTSTNNNRFYVVTQPAATTVTNNNMQNTMEPNYAMSNWTWPTKGKVVNYFSSANKGVNIVGQEGEPIRAVGAGKVVYAGDGLRGYGNLIIIKHNSLYLSAYAHNSRILVKEGEWVKQGQIIAEMGKTGTDKVMLHLEIRRAGKPVDPLSLL